MAHTPDEAVEEAARAVLKEHRKVHSLEKFHSLVRERLRGMDEDYTVSRARLRRLVLSRKVGRVDINSSDRDQEDFPGDCPVCGSPMKNVKNETLYGWEVTLQRKCTVCPFWSGKQRRVPALYVFNHK